MFASIDLCASREPLPRRYWGPLVVETMPGERIAAASSQNTAEVVELTPLIRSCIHAPMHLCSLRQGAWLGGADNRGGRGTPYALQPGSLHHLRGRYSAKQR